MSRPDFSALLEKSNQLAAQTFGDGFPSLHRGIEQLEEVSRRMASTIQPPPDSAKVKAAHLLAGRGFDADRLSRNLSSINFRTTFEPLEALAETDVEGFLRHQHKMIILTAIEEQNKEITATLRKNYLASLRQDWESTKQKLMDSLGQRVGAWTSELSLQATTAAPSSSAADPSSRGVVRGLALRRAGPPPGQASAEYLYSEVVKLLNQRRRQHLAFAIISQLKTATEKANDHDKMRNEDMVRCFRILQCMVDETQVTATGDFAANPMEGHYADQYHARDSTLTLDLLRGAKRFLERQYKELVIDGQVRKNPAAARRGGTPGTLHDVVAYLRVVRAPSEHQEFEGVPLWPLVLHCLRCGDTKAALEVLKEVAASDPVTTALANTIARQRVMEGTLEDLRREYESLGVQGKSVHKQAVYNLVGKLDPRSYRRDLFPYSEDYMWFSLSMLDEGAGLRPGLEALQKQVVEWGPKHFVPAGRSPLRYVHLLLMIQHFERAVDFLWGREGYQVEAVHTAVALGYYGLMHLPNSDTPELLTTDLDRTYLNYGSLLGRYVSTVIEPTRDLQTAVEYVMLVPEKLSSGLLQRREYLAELVYSTRSYLELLGVPLPDATRKKGLLHAYVRDEEAHAIAATVAERCERSGQIDAAVTLYDLAQEYARAIAVLNRSLGTYVTRQGPQRTAVVQHARSIANSYRASGVLNAIAATPAVLTFLHLLYLADFFDLYHANRFQDALEVASKSELVPADEASVEAAARKLRTYDDAVRECIPDLLSALMTCIYNIYQNSVLPSPKPQILQRLQHMASVVLRYASEVNQIYHLPLDLLPALLKAQAHIT